MRNPAMVLGALPLAAAMIQARQRHERGCATCEPWGDVPWQLRLLMEGTLRRAGCPDVRPEACPHCGRRPAQAWNCFDDLLLPAASATGGVTGQSGSVTPEQGAAIRAFHALPDGWRWDTLTDEQRAAVLTYRAQK